MFDLFAYSFDFGVLDFSHSDFVYVFVITDLDV